MRAVDPRVSFAEMQTWPDDGRQYELYDGEVIVLPSPIARHQRVVGHTAAAFREHERQSGGLAFFAPLDIVLDEYNVVQPDVVFFTRQRRHLIDMMKPTRAVPDLAVEVLSRTTEARDRGRKLRLLARFGLAEYWVVDPIANTVEIHTNDAGTLVPVRTFAAADEIVSPTLPGLRIAPGQLFAE